METQVLRELSQRKPVTEHLNSCIELKRVFRSRRRPLAEGPIQLMQNGSKTIHSSPAALALLENKEHRTEPGFLKKLFMKLRSRVQRIGKPFISDTLAGFSFSMTVCIPIEVGLAGMALEQSLHARLASLPFNLLLSGPYGIFRNWTYKITKTTPESSQAKKFFVDLGTFIAGQLPFYAVIVASSGADLRQTLISCASLAAASPLFGRPLGAWYDFVRTRLFRTPPAGASSDEKESPQKTNCFLNDPL